MGGVYLLVVHAAEKARLREEARDGVALVEGLWRRRGRDAEKRSRAKKEADWTLGLQEES